jgi:hypothetical protein
VSGPVNRTYRAFRALPRLGGSVRECRGCCWEKERCAFAGELVAIRGFGRLEFRIGVPLSFEGVRGGSVVRSRAYNRICRDLLRGMFGL